jgi:hypothetical protein
MGSQTALDLPIAAVSTLEGRYLLPGGTYIRPIPAQRHVSRAANIRRPG